MWVGELGRQEGGMKELVLVSNVIFDVPMEVT